MNPSSDRMPSEGPVDLERLLFRRQFLLGPHAFAPNQYWSCVQLPRDLRLSIHVDLPFTSISKEDVTLTLIGYAIDPNHPLITERDIASALISNASKVESVINSTASLVGRWVIIVQNQDDTYLFTDPFGYRQAFYYSDGKQHWCASQPELIRANCRLRLNTDNRLISFLMHPEHARRESSWVGPKTIYENCFHLMPNHYLSFERMAQARFYPDKILDMKTTSDIVEIVCASLQGVMAGLTSRYNVVLALTAGWDSRVLLAASKDVSEKIEYFVYSPGAFRSDHPDVWVPRSIAKKLAINFVVRSSGNDLPGWFTSILSQNVTCAPVLPKTLHIYDKLVRGDDRININGNGSEICRNFFDKFCDLDPRELSVAELTGRLFGKNTTPFVIQELNEWRSGLECSSVEGLNILDLLYWEQRLGNWGALYPAQQDIAVDEISPFNCRLLIETLLSSPRQKRAAPDYPVYQELIRHMWPEALAFPINPPPKGDFVGALKQRIRRYIPSWAGPVLKKLKEA